MMDHTLGLACTGRSGLGIVILKLVHLSVYILSSPIKCKAWAHAFVNVHLEHANKHSECHTGRRTHRRCTSYLHP